MSRLTLPVNDADHRAGDPASPVNLVEYGDYQCSTCKMSFPVIKQLEKELGDKLSFVFRHFPLSTIHPFAKKAAEAAEAAALQNKFWEMHDLLYKNQLSMSDDLFPQLAKELNLNLKQFETDRQSPALAEKIEAQFEAGVRSGVNGTPCFYINDERYDGDPSYETLKQALIAAATPKS